mmetsp:Transcript_4295/g.17430  ORF Transcript_4295/g.17430 Transcript_4295/m.17430 type:complete len:331 (-) Transcript_4295:19-1011(-)
MATKLVESMRTKQTSTGIHLSATRGSNLGYETRPTARHAATMSVATAFCMRSNDMWAETSSVEASHLLVRTMTVEHATYMQHDAKAPDALAFCAASSLRAASDFFNAAGSGPWPLLNALPVGGPAPFSSHDGMPLCAASPLSSFCVAAGPSGPPGFSIGAANSSVRLRLLRSSSMMHGPRRRTSVAAAGGTARRKNVWVDDDDVDDSVGGGRGGFGQSVSHRCFFFPSRRARPGVRRRRSGLRRGGAVGRRRRSEACRRPSRPCVTVETPPRINNRGQKQTTTESGLGAGTAVRRHVGERRDSGRRGALGDARRVWCLGRRRLVVEDALA